MISVGIDPGVTGGLAIVDHNGLKTVGDLPAIERSRKKGKGKAKQTVINQVDPVGLRTMLRDLLTGTDKNEVRVYLELVNSRPLQSSQSVFSMGHSSGIIEGVVGALGYRLFFIPPSEWKPGVELKPVKIAPEADPETEQMKRRRKGAEKREQKRQACARVCALYPSADVTLVKHHNRAEAALIAHYGYEQHA